MKTTDEQIEETKKYIRIGSEVKVWRDGKVIHWGTVVGLTNSFAHVFRPRRNQDDTGGDIEPSMAQAFPLSAPNGSFISLVEAQ